MTFAIIPVKRFENSKSRLAPLLSLPERLTLSGLMLSDTLDVLTSSKCFDKILVVSGDSRANEIACAHGAEFIFQEHDAGVNAAVALADTYSINANADATVVVPQDLPLMTVRDIAGVCALADRTPYVAVCPSLRFDGTNILLRRPPMAITTRYDDNSYENHLQAARAKGLKTKVINSKNLMFDLDTPDDVLRLAKLPDRMIAAKQTSCFIKSVVSDGAS